MAPSDALPCPLSTWDTTTGDMPALWPISASVIPAKLGSAAGETAATMYTLIASTSRHHLDLWAYLDDVLRRLAGGQSEMEPLLPDRWRAAHPQSIRTHGQAEQEIRRAKTKDRRARRRKLAARRG